MKMPLCFLFLFACSLAVADVPLPSELGEYVKRPEPEAGWTVAKQETIANCDVTQLSLTSQVWHDIKWEHDLAIFVPKGASTKTVYLMNSGGKASPRNAGLGVAIASKIKAPVAIVLGVPKQPLYDGLHEDDLIAETFVRYLDSGDGTWPLLFPMVKSVVKAMDAIQELSAKEWPEKTEKFIVGGASKRGWTTWLTAASDPRVVAITPMVIDVLNMQVQLVHQVEAFGAPSEQIEPYTKRGLVPMPDTDSARKLWKMVDPYTYRTRYTMPKLVVLGNNDRYWTADALNLYWDGLPGDNKYISYTANAGHDLTERGPDGKKIGPLPARAINDIGAFVRRVITGSPMPQLTWKHDDAEGGQLRVTVTADQKPNEARLWVASAKTQDFRESRWEARPLEVPAEGPVTATLPRPSEGFVAYYADLGYQVDDIPQWLSTQLRVAGSTAEKAN